MPSSPLEERRHRNRRHDDDDNDNGDRGGRSYTRYRSERSRRSRSRSRRRSRSRSRSRSRRKRSKSKSGKSRRNYNRSSEEDSNSDDSSRERRKEKRRAREERAHLKSLETPEQRNARRLEKKKRKKERKKAESIVCGFDNESNPFGDSQLSEVFVWGKKIEANAGGARSSSSKKAELEKAERKRLKRRQMDLREEVFAIKKRKEERELEQDQLNELREQMQREAEREVNADWDRKEEEFHKEQARTRSKIRLREKRERPIDVLAKNLFVIDREERRQRPRGHGDQDDEDDMEVELFDPCAVFRGLDLSELNVLSADIQSYADLGDSLDYWNALAVVCADEIEKATVPERASTSAMAAVHEEVVSLLLSKKLRELHALKLTAERKLNYEDRSDGVAIDVDYWTEILQSLDVFMARAFLKEFHSDLLRRRLAQLTQMQPKAVAADVTEHDQVEPVSEAAVSADRVVIDADFSPVLIRDDEELEAIAIDEADDAKALQEKRLQVLKERYARHVQGNGRIVPRPEQSSREPSEAKQKADDVDLDEEKFDQQVQLPDQVYWWHDKYRPRKPLFFNKVKTGFEWSKYNQTHYDRDNPPPKVVQGYKFNIFYPDLIDASKPPSFKIEKIPDNADFCILRFSAGPPYEDIAFKIVKKEWERSHRRGYKCKFEKGVLHLYINFKRFRYRR